MSAGAKCRAACRGMRGQCESQAGPWQPCRAAITVIATGISQPTSLCLLCCSMQGAKDAKEAMAQGDKEAEKLEAARVS